MGDRLKRSREVLAANVPWVAPLLAALVCLGATLQALYQLSYATFGRDQGIFAYVGWALRNGQRAYRDFHEINGPLPHAWNVLLQTIGGEDEHVFRSIDTAFMVLVYAASAVTLPRWMGLSLKRPVLAAWALAGFAVLGAQFARYDWWHANQREGFYAALVLGSLALQAAAHQTRSARHAVVLFALAAMATSLTWFGKPPCVIFVFLQLSVLVLDRSAVAITLKRAVVASAVGVAASTALMAVFVAIYADFGDGFRFLSHVPLLHHTIWNHTIAETYRAYDNAPRLDWAMATTAGFLVAYFVLRLPRRTLLALVLPVGGFVVFAGQGKGFPYHLQMVTLGTSVLQLVILLALAVRGNERKNVLAFIAAVAAIALGFKCRDDARLSPAARSHWATLGSTKERRASREYLASFEWGDFFTEDLHDAAKYVTDHTAADDRVQTYGLDPFFLFLAKRQTATPIIYNFELNIDPALEGGSGAKLTAEERTALLAHRDAAEKLILDRVKSAPPAAFVFFDRAPFSHPDDGEVDFETHCPDVYKWLEPRYAAPVLFGTARVRLRNDIAAKLPPAIEPLAP